MMSLYNTLTKEEFDKKVLHNNKVVVVDFWAEWCPPCRAMAPILAAIAEKMSDDVEVVKVDIEASGDNSQLATTYGIQSIPNLHIFKAGTHVGQLVGLVPEAHLKDELKKYIDTD
ncbi:thioredoxin [Candidatus Saccharibacteria bacterium]|nr:MAG: thioredoxin [Candidatus Saccharibacteria bacterium]